MDILTQERPAVQPGPFGVRAKGAKPRKRPQAGQGIGYRFDPVPRELREDIREGRLIPTDELVLAELLRWRTRVCDSAWCTNRAIAKSLGVTPITVQRSLARLRTWGWIDRVSIEGIDPDDPRNQTGWRFVFCWFPGRGAPFRIGPKCLPMPVKRSKARPDQRQGQLFAEPAPGEPIEATEGDISGDTPPIALVIPPPVSPVIPNSEIVSLRECEPRETPPSPPAGGQEQTRTDHPLRQRQETTAEQLPAAACCEPSEPVPCKACADPEASKEPPAACKPAPRPDPPPEPTPAEAAPAAVDTSTWSDAAQRFWQSLSPEERARWPALTPGRQRQILEGLAVLGFDPAKPSAAVTEARRALEPPASPDPPADASIEDLIRALPGRPDRLMPTVRALMVETDDHPGSWRYVEGILARVVSKNLDPEIIVAPLLRVKARAEKARAEGNPIRKLAAYYTTALQEELAKHELQ